MFSQACVIPSVHGGWGAGSAWRSLPMGGVCIRGGICQGEVCIQLGLPGGICIQEGLHPGGSASRGSVSRGSASRGFASRGWSASRGGSAFGGVCIQGGGLHPGGRAKAVCNKYFYI